MTLLLVQVLCELITRVKISDHLQRKPAEAFGLNVSQLQKLIPADCPPEFAQIAIGMACLTSLRRM